MANKRNVGGYVVAGLFTILEVLIIGVGYGVFDWPPAILIPIIGLLTFFGVLIIVNVFSASSDLRKGEVRNAIAASLLAVYFFVVAVALFAPASPVYRVEELGSIQPQEAITPETTETSDTEDALGAEIVEEEAGATSANDIVKGLLDDYTSLIIVVVGFYFGGRSAEEIVKTLRGSRPGTGPSSEPQEPGDETGAGTSSDPKKPTGT